MTDTLFSEPTTPATTDRDKALNTVFITALEGGIGYWSVCTLYRWFVPGTDYVEAKDFVAHIYDHEGDGVVTDETPFYVIDRSVISRGISRAYEARGKGNDDYHARALADLQFGRYDEADYDADTADLIVQYGLFGRAIYG